MQLKEATQSITTYLIDEKGILSVNKNFEGSRTGVTRSLKSGDSIFHIYADHPQMIDLIHRAIKGEQITQEVSFNDVTFIHSFTPILDSKGKFQKAIGTFLDITESKKTEEAVRKSEFRLRSLFNSADDAIFMMDNKTFIDCNPATLRIFKCAKDQIVGQTPYRFSPFLQPDGRTSEEAAMEKINAALSGKPQFFEWRHTHYDGTTFEAEVSLNRLDLENEVFIQAMVRDVSERKRAEEENKRLALVANTTTNMVVIADGDGVIEWVNPAFTRVTGYTWEEAVGKIPGRLLRGKKTDPEIARMMGEKIRAGQGFKEVEIINYTKSGNPYWVSIEVVPVHDKNGKVVQFIAIESDISERKATQQALLDRNDELIKANTELDRFVYSASHDLRAPISSLLGLIEVARLEKDVDSMRNLLDLQKKSLQRLDRFIKDIVDHSRNTRLKVESEPVNFEQIIHSIVEQLQFMDNVSRIRRIISIKQQGEFYTSPTRLDLIFNNLISNAIKYADMRKEDPFLEVIITTNSSWAEIRVRDNGEGIPEEAQAKIFDMFYRASARASGSGLGLYIVKEAIQKIQGTVEVTSEFGKGTEFIVSIPNLYTVYSQGTAESPLIEDKQLDPRLFLGKRL
jgi:PAS domain S-box-containing protein